MLSHLRMAAPMRTAALRRAFSTAAASPSPIAARLSDPTLLRSHSFIDGEWVGAVPGSDAATGTLSVRSPTTGLELGRIPRLGAAETTRAIEAAGRAQVSWAAMTAKARGDILTKWFQLCMENQKDLATILTMEQGKPMAEAMGEVRAEQSGAGGAERRGWTRRDGASGREAE